jgi:predicted transcriptional regulator
MMKPAKAMTIRLSADQAELLETVASVDGQPVSEVIRAAIASHIESRRQDAAFQDGLKDRLARAQQLLTRKGR